MNQSSWIAKTITNKRGYSLNHWRSKYDTEKEAFSFEHYGTTILSISFSQRFKNGEYATLGGGWSSSDTQIIYEVIRHLNDTLHTEYEYILYTDRNEKQQQKRRNEQYTIISTDNNHVLAIPKPKKQATLYSFEPYLTLADSLNEELNIVVKAFTDGIQEDLKTQLEYLKTFTNANLEIDQNGITINNIFINWQGDVYDTQHNEKICVQVSPYDTATENRTLTKTDICITKALGLLKKPETLKEGIRHKIDKINKPSLAETMINDNTFTSKRDSINQKLEVLQETRIYESFKKRIRYGLAWYVHNGRWRENAYSHIKHNEVFKTIQTVFFIDATTIRLKLKKED